MADTTLHLTRYRTPPACELKIPPRAPAWYVCLDVEFNGLPRSIALTYSFMEEADAERALKEIRSRYPAARIQEVTS